MIRVAYLFSYSASWNAGLIYLRNLITTIMDLPDRRIEPVLLATPETPESDFADFPGIEVIRTPLVRLNLPAKLLARGTETLIGRNLALELFLRRHRINAVSHSGYLGARSSVPAIAWLPDFQHVRMPEFFTPKEVAMRNRAYARTARAAQTILLSSEDAQRDLARIVPETVGKSRVLRFTAGMVQPHDSRGGDFLRQTYGIDRPFFYLPNQFWRHKNHRLVIDALALLARNGEAPLVVSTGKTEDRRNPDHFTDLMRHAEESGGGPFFKVLGMIPYDQLSVLSRLSVALINPSRFEGWSTTVEEAKSLGKTIILSDIPVHREQAPARGIYVPPDDPEAMATALRTTLAAWSPEEDAAALAEAAASLPARRLDFGERYQRIVVDTVKRTRDGKAAA
jgi:glycosyltransferase involved in cell wall biosynthesis